jgi:hypothetical protein
VACIVALLSLPQCLGVGTLYETLFPCLWLDDHSRFHSWHIQEVANILASGIKLREYTKGVENNIRQIELDSIQVIALGIAISSLLNS